jgi:hypothetical protein
MKTIPHLKNINQDPIMSGKIKKTMINGNNIIGKKDPNSEVRLELAGMGVVQNHALVEYDEANRTAFISPN